MTPNAIENFVGQTQANQIIKVVANAIACRTETLIGESNEKVGKAAMKRLQELTFEHNEEGKRAYLHRERINQTDPHSVQKINKTSGPRLSF